MSSESHAQLWREQWNDTRIRDAGRLSLAESSNNASSAAGANPVRHHSFIVHPSDSLFCVHPFTRSPNCAFFPVDVTCPLKECQTPHLPQDRHRPYYFRRGQPLPGLS